MKSNDEMNNLLKSKLMSVTRQNTHGKKPKDDKKNQNIQKYFAEDS